MHVWKKGLTGAWVRLQCCRRHWARKFLYLWCRIGVVLLLVLGSGGLLRTSLWASGHTALYPDRLLVQLHTMTLQGFLVPALL